MGKKNRKTIVNDWKRERKRQKKSKSSKSLRQEKKSADSQKIDCRAQRGFHSSQRPFRRHDQTGRFHLCLFNIIICSNKHLPTRIFITSKSHNVELTESTKEAHFSSVQNEVQQRNITFILHFSTVRFKLQISPRV